MNELAKTLTQHLDKNSRLQIWHVLVLLAFLWAIPTILPAQFDIIVGTLGIIGYFWANRLIKRAVRISSLDIILVERFFIFLGFLWPTTWTVVYGIRYDFNIFITIALIAEGLVLSFLALGIALHIKNRNKYYHGVKKDELFK